MSLKSALVDLKDVLTAQTVNDTPLAKLVSLYDYSILDAARPYALILEPGEIEYVEDVYHGWERRMSIVVRVFSYYDPAGIAASTQRFVDLVDVIDNALIDNVYLGKTAADYRQAFLRHISPTTVEARAAGEAMHEWLMGVATVWVVESIVEGASAQ